MKPIEINGKTLILFDSNAYTRSHISYDSIFVAAWQDLLFLYIFSKASSDLFRYYYFPSWTYHTSSHFNISRGLPDFPTREQLNFLLRCDLCDSPNPPVWLLNATVIKNKTTNKSRVLFFANSPSQNFFLFLSSLFFKSFSFHNVCIWILVGDTFLSYLLLLPLVSRPEQNYFMQQILQEYQVTTVGICSLYAVGTI